MIKTGDWSTSDLVKYLVAVQSTLSPDELERLRLTSAFPKEASSTADTGKVSRFKASDLYEPLDSFRALGLPLLDWGTKAKWRNNSDEGQCLCPIWKTYSHYFIAKFLYNLGLRRIPPMDVLLGLASGSDSKVRGLALRYYLDNANTKYNNYSPLTYANMAFVPAVKDKQLCMAKPTEVRSRLHSSYEFTEYSSRYRSFPIPHGPSWDLLLLNRT